MVGSRVIVCLREEGEIRDVISLETRGNLLLGTHWIVQSPC